MPIVLGHWLRLTTITIVTLVSPVLVHPAVAQTVGDGATEHLVSNQAEWAEAVASAQPGDVIRLTATINSRLEYRGDNDGGPASGVDGTAQQPIVITSDPGVWIDPGNITNDRGALDLLHVDHVHAVGVRVRNSQFGIRCHQCHGSPAAPIQITNNVVTDIGHAGIHVGGHWSTHEPSSNVVVKGNTVTRTGRSAARYGEGIYIGYGSSEWIDTTSEVTIIGNNIGFTTAEGIDIKPGTTNIVVADNLLHDISPIDGGSISAHYVNSTANPHPEQLDRVVITGNRIWNQNLNGAPGANDWAIWVGHGGVEVTGNRIWAMRDRDQAIGVRVRAMQDFGPHPIVIKDNVFWVANGWVATGQPDPTSNIEASHNQGPNSAGNEIVMDVTGFAGPIPPLGEAGDADSGSGPGSGFDPVETGQTSPSTAPVASGQLSAVATARAQSDSLDLSGATSAAPDAKVPDNAKSRTNPTSANHADVQQAAAATPADSGQGLRLRSTVSSTPETPPPSGSWWGAASALGIGIVLGTSGLILRYILHGRKVPHTV